MKLSLLSVSILLSTTIGLTGCNNEQQTMNNAVHGLHLQSAKQFASTAEELDADIALLCRNYSEEQLLTTRTAWKNTMGAWMQLQGREKGSEEALALSWQIQFWPDKKDTTGRKLKQLLKQDKTWTANNVSEESIAVQGMGAIEWFLYEQPTQLQEAQGCNLANGIGDRIAQSGQQLEKAWQDNPWQQMTPQLALSEYLGALNNQLDYSMKKLSRPLGKPGIPKPYQAESWRSATSLSNLKASTKAMQDLYLANGHGLDALLRAKGYANTANQIKDRFTLLLDAWPKSPSMVALLKTKDGYRELLNVYNGLEYILFALQDDVAPELGIAVGFNATDGD
jgi:uncharacterized protein